MNQDFETLREEMEQALGGLDGHQTQLKPRRRRIAMERPANGGTSDNGVRRNRGHL